MAWCFIDKITDLQPGKSAAAEQTFTGEEDFFADHFPSGPVVPGVLQIEMMAFLGGVALNESCDRPNEINVLLGMIKKAKFHRPLLAKEKCTVSVQFTELEPTYGIYEGSIEVGGAKVAEATLVSLLREGKRSPSSEKLAREYFERRGGKST
jgi:3-hydroxyacyl-[acyl-carrier-protein] dehydratase